jgi:DNA-binding MarR family transcriptional regulator
MVRMGLVTRARSRLECREVLVELSAEGRGLVERLIPIARGLEEAAIAGLTRAELAVAKQALRRMYANLEHPRAARRPPPRD